ncbi:MAG: CoA transferase [Hyphomicrobiaceae bacterium]
MSSAANSIAKRLFRAIGRPDLADDPTLATNPQRVERVEECDGAIARWIAERTQEEALRTFRECEVVAGPIYDVAQLFADEHVRERRTIIEIDDPLLRKVRLQNVVPRFSRNPGHLRWPGKELIGSDTREILSELGFGDLDIQRLNRDRVIKTA